MKKFKGNHLLTAPENREEWEEQLVRKAAYFTCSIAKTGPRPRGTRLEWDVTQYTSLLAATLAAARCMDTFGGRALVYAVSKSGDSAPLSRKDWPRYLQLRGE